MSPSSLSVVLPIALVLVMDLPASAGAEPRGLLAPIASGSKSSLSTMRMRRIRNGTAVIQDKNGALVLAKVGTRLGDRRDIVSVVESDRLTLRGQRLVDGERRESTTILTWDAHGTIHEQRIESTLRQGIADPSSRHSRPTPSTVPHSPKGH